MAKIDFSICLHGSAPVVRNFFGVSFDAFLQWMQPGEVWDGIEQPQFRTAKTPLYDHKTYNGYIASTFLPTTKSGDPLRAGPANPTPGYRNAANVAKRSLIMLDFDALPVGTMAKVLAFLRNENALGVVYTTYNHLNAEKGGLERFRAVIVTDVAMEAGEIGRASYSFYDMMKQSIPEIVLDVASYNPAFAMYRPPSNSQVTVLHGEPWSADDLLDDFDHYDLALPVKAFTTGNWEPATPADMKLCEDWLAWAHENNLTVSDGQIWVCCPMHDRHSTGSLGDGTDGGAAILLPSKRKGQATFKCLHSTCDSDVNRNQRDTMMAISEALESPIPAHLLPDPHGGYGAEDRAKMRRMLAAESEDFSEYEDDEDFQDDEPAAPANGVQQRVRKEGAVDTRSLPAYIGGKYGADIMPNDVGRLIELSKKFVFVVQGGRSSYMQLQGDKGREFWKQISIQTAEDQLAPENAITGIIPKGDEAKRIRITLFDAYHHWAGRRQYLGGASMFPPPLECPSDMLNTWRGFAVDPEEGDVSPFVDYVKTVLCSNDEDLAHYVTQWLAHMVQMPGEKPGVAMVMKSGEGNGKGQLAKLLDRMLGEVFVQYNGTEKLTGQFNAALMKALCAFVDEAKAKGQDTAMIRGLVTESRAMFESKGSDAVKGQSFNRIILASNEHAVTITKGDRRYCALPMNDKYAANDSNPDREKIAVPYWRKYSNWVNQSWVPAAVLHYLLNYSLDGFDSFNAPKTTAHRELVREGLTQLQEWILWQATENKFKKGLLISRPNEVALIPNIVAAAFIEYQKETSGRVYRTPMSVKNEFGRIMKNMGIQKTDLGSQHSTENRYAYLFETQDDLYFDICDALGVNPEYD